MGGSKSKQQSKSSTETTNIDARTAGGRGVTIGQSGKLVVQEEFSDNVRRSFDELVGLSRDAGKVAQKTSERAQETAQKAITATAGTAAGAQTLVRDVVTGAGNIIDRVVKSTRDTTQKSVEALARQRETEETSDQVEVIKQIAPIAGVTIGAILLVTLIRR